MRRYIIPVILCIFLLVTGCTSPLHNNRTEDLSCTLNHEIVYDDDRVDTIRQQYTYAELSSPAKNGFDGALAANGTTYSVENSSTTAAEEFEYTDAYTYYEIEYDGNQYVLATWTSEGCIVN